MTLCSAPRIALVASFISDAEIEDLKLLAEPKLIRSTVSTRAERKGLSDRRTSESATLSGGHGLVARLMERAAEAAGYPAGNCEPLQVVRYRAGEEYDNHFDWYDAGQESHQAILAARGQRMTTVIAYLSNVEMGGATMFPKINVKINPRKGFAALWDNCLPNSTVGNPLTLHRGEKVIEGEKWIANFWLHEGRYVRHASAEVEPRGD